MKSSDRIGYHMSAETGEWEESSPGRGWCRECGAKIRFCECIARPSFADEEHGIRLRVMGKQGQRLTDEETDFLKKLYRDYPGWASETRKRVFQESAPFGNNL